MSSPDRLRRFAEDLEQEGQPQLARDVRRAADALERSERLDAYNADDDDAVLPRP